MSMLITCLPEMNYQKNLFITDGSNLSIMTLESIISQFDHDCTTISLKVYRFQSKMNSSNICFTFLAIFIISQHLNGEVSTSFLIKSSLKYKKFKFRS